MYFYSLVSYISLCSRNSAFVLLSGIPGNPGQPGAKGTQDLLVVALQTLIFEPDPSKINSHKCLLQVKLDKQEGSSMQVRDHNKPISQILFYFFKSECLTVSFVFSWTLFCRYTRTTRTCWSSRACRTSRVVRSGSVLNTSRQ